MGARSWKKGIFFSTDLEKTFSLLLVSHRETNAKGQPYKPPATLLTLTKIFEEDGVGFGEGKGKLSRESFPRPLQIPNALPGRFPQGAKAAEHIRQHVFKQALRIAGSGGKHEGA